jgi:hypothetical protein
MDSLPEHKNLYHELRDMSQRAVPSSQDHGGKMLYLILAYAKISACLL